MRHSKAVSSFPNSDFHLANNNFTEDSFCFHNTLSGFLFIYINFLSCREIAEVLTRMVVGWFDSMPGHDRENPYYILNLKKGRLDLPTRSQKFFEILEI